MGQKSKSCLPCHHTQPRSQHYSTLNCHIQWSTAEYERLLRWTLQYYVRAPGQEKQQLSTRSWWHKQAKPINFIPLLAQTQHLFKFLSPINILIPKSTNKEVWVPHTQLKAKKCLDTVPQHAKNNSLESLCVLMVAELSQGSLAKAFPHFPPIDLPTPLLQAPSTLSSQLFPSWSTAVCSNQHYRHERPRSFQYFPTPFLLFCFRQPGGNECNITGALSDAFIPLWLKSTDHRGDSHTDLWSWAGFRTVLHGFWFWRVWLRFHFLGLFLRTGRRNWGANSGIRHPLQRLQLISLFIVNLLCIMVSKQSRDSWFCNKIICPLLLAIGRIQDQWWASQWANTLYSSL